MELGQIQAGRVHRVDYHGLRDAMVVETRVMHDGRMDGVRIRLLEDVDKGDEVQVLNGSQVVITAGQVHGRSVSD